MNQIKDMEISENTKPKDETPSSSVYIPEWFLVELLCRLPSKSVFRFKCVSKQLLTLISEPSFVRDYISRASSSSSKPLPWTFLTRAMLPAQDEDHPCGESFERNLSDSNTLDSPSISMLVTPNCSSIESCQVLAISNGLCLCSWDWDCNYFKTYSIFNPVTNQFIVLPWTRGTHCCDMAFHAHVDQEGAVSYKMVRLLFEYGAPPTDVIVEELSSDTFKWTSFTTKFPEPVFSDDNFLTPFSFRGIFHWVNVYSHDGFGCILSYDPLQIIRCPGFGHMIWCGAIVSADGEETMRCIKEEYILGIIYVWRLKDYEKLIWQLDHKFDLCEVVLPYADNKMLTCTMLKNLTLHPREPDLLHFWGKADQEDEWMLVSFNLGTRKSRVSDAIPRVSAYGKLMSFLDIHVTPFVLPPWPAILPHPSQ